MKELTTSLLVLLAVGALGCESGGVGDPCIPEDEYNPGFSGYSAEEVNIESRSFQCETRVCIANHFQGRVSCRYGQGNGENLCKIPGSATPIEVAVDPQLELRPADKAVYCSCRCGNADGKTDDGARYCECPSGYSCSKLLDDLGLGKGQLAGYYCIKDGTEYDPNNAGPKCNRETKNCGEDD